MITASKQNKAQVKQNRSSNAITWLLLATVLWGVNRVNKTITYKHKEKDKDKTEQTTPEKEEQNTKSQEQRYVAIKDSYKCMRDDGKTIITVDTRDLAKIMPYVYMLTYGTESYHRNPEDLGDNASATRGPGLTWYYWEDWVNGELVVHRRALKTTDNGMSQDEYFRQVKLHYVYEVWPLFLRRVADKSNNFSDKEKAALLVVGYQNGATMCGVATHLAKAKGGNSKIQAFYNTNGIGKRYKHGTRNRNLHLALWAEGKISDSEYLDMNRAGWSTLSKVSTTKGEKFNLSDENVARIKNQIINGVSGLVFHDKNHPLQLGDFLEQSASGRIVVANVHNYNPAQMEVHTQEIAPDTLTIINFSSPKDSNNVQNKQNLEQKYADSALGAYRLGYYETAAQLYEDLVENAPDNALYRNDLAATYNKLNRWGDALLQSKYVLKKIGDKSQYAAAQYNAGYAYEKKGDLERALKNYELSVKNGNKSVQKDVDRLNKKMQKGTAVKSKKDKRTAFNTGTKKIKSQNNGFIRKLNAHVRRGNMA